MAIKELVVISGKGGTGKTSVTASLAVLSAGKAVMTDADVDGANLELVLQASMLGEWSITGGRKAKIKPSLCAACGRCADICRFGAVIPAVPHSNGGMIMQIDSDLCEGCGLCIRFCPQSAISLQETKAGAWRHSQTPWGDLFHARLAPGGDNSGKLVTILRRAAREHAQNKGLEYMLTDGPPGSGCPVIATLTGASYVLVITEPTPSGLSDAERVVQLSKHFRRNVGIIINKWDLHPQMTRRIEVWADHQQIGVLGRLPFDPVVPAAVRAGVPVLTLPNSDWGKALIQVAQNLPLPPSG